MKIYIYNVNNKNEFLELKIIKTDLMRIWAAIATTLEPPKSELIGKSYAFNPKENQWNILINDWRGITLYFKYNSLITKEGSVDVLPENFTNVIPPDKEKSYKFINNQWLLIITLLEKEDKKLSKKEDKTLELIIKEYLKKIQEYVDKVAQDRGYENGCTCASYSDDKNHRYASDAKIFKDWRSDVWTYVNNLLINFQTKQIEKLLTIEEVIAQLPCINWID